MKYQEMWKVYPSTKWPGLYLDWFNNFLTVEKFAEYYGMTEEHAQEIVTVGITADEFLTYLNEVK